jgi:hypothetical protein
VDSTGDLSSTPGHKMGNRGSFWKACCTKATFRLRALNRVLKRY